jgi:hypothetical protein
MTLRYRALEVLLWYVVLAWATWLGGTLYQMVVVVPLWSAAPPESVYAFFGSTDYNRTIFHFFGPPFMAARTVPLLVALALAWPLPGHRRALALASACVVAATLFTIVYVYPINAVLFAEAGAGLSAAEVDSLAQQWIWADRARSLVGLVAFVAILRAFRLPLPR